MLLSCTNLLHLCALALIFQYGSQFKRRGLIHLSKASAQAHAHAREQELEPRTASWLRIAVPREGLPATNGERYQNYKKREGTDSSSSHPS
jgi:hypothetical protein